MVRIFARLRCGYYVCCGCCWFTRFLLPVTGYCVLIVCYGIDVCVCIATTSLRWFYTVGWFTVVDVFYYFVLYQLFFWYWLLLIPVARCLPVHHTITRHFTYTLLLRFTFCILHIRWTDYVPHLFAHTFAIRTLLPRFHTRCLQLFYRFPLHGLRHSVAHRTRGTHTFCGFAFYLQFLHGSGYYHIVGCYVATSPHTFVLPTRTFFARIYCIRWLRTTPVRVYTAAFVSLLRVHRFRTLIAYHTACVVLRTLLHTLLQHYRLSRVSAHVYLHLPLPTTTTFQLHTFTVPTCRVTYVISWFYGWFWFMVPVRLRSSWPPHRCVGCSSCPPTYLFIHFVTRFGYLLLQVIFQLLILPFFPRYTFVVRCLHVVHFTRTLFTFPTLTHLTAFKFYTTLLIFHLMDILLLPFTVPLRLVLHLILLGLVMHYDFVYYALFGLQYFTYTVGPPPLRYMCLVSSSTGLSYTFRLDYITTQLPPQRHFRCCALLSHTTLLPFPTHTCCLFIFSFTHAFTFYGWTWFATFFTAFRIVVVTFILCVCGGDSVRYITGFGLRIYALRSPHGCTLHGWVRYCVLLDIVLLLVRLVWFNLAGSDIAFYVQDLRAFYSLVTHHVLCIILVILSLRYILHVPTVVGSQLLLANRITRFTFYIFCIYVTVHNSTIRYIYVTVCCFPHWFTLHFTHVVYVYGLVVAGLHSDGYQFSTLVGHVIITIILLYILHLLPLRCYFVFPFYGLGYPFTRYWFWLVRSVVPTFYCCFALLFVVVIPLGILLRWLYICCSGYARLLFTRRLRSLHAYHSLCLFLHFVILVPFVICHTVTVVPHVLHLPLFGYLPRLLRLGYTHVCTHRICSHCIGCC